MDDLIVLVDENNRVLGTLSKLEAHNKNTPLHRAFSLFLFNSKGKLLLQQRSSKKKTWPLVWSNSCCGHPRPNEKTSDAVKRRLKFELGIEDINIFEVIPDYRYTAEQDGMVENEICPVFFARTDSKLKINSKEIRATKWIAWKDWVNEIKKNPNHYSPWCVEETKLLEENKKFLKLYNN